MERWTMHASEHRNPREGVYKPVERGGSWCRPMSDSNLSSKEQVQRYYRGTQEMQPSQAGDWVLYRDYERLQRMVMEFIEGPPAQMTTPLGMLPINSTGMRRLVDALNRATGEPAASNSLSRLDRIGALLDKLPTGEGLRYYHAGHELVDAREALRALRAEYEPAAPPPGTGPAPQPDDEPTLVEPAPLPSPTGETPQQPQSSPHDSACATRLPKPAHRDRD